jgi:hypothetical protein
MKFVSLVVEPSSRPISRQQVQRVSCFRLQLITPCLHAPLYPAAHQRPSKPLFSRPLHLPKSPAFEFAFSYAVPALLIPNLPSEAYQFMSAATLTNTPSFQHSKQVHQPIE